MSFARIRAELKPAILVLSSFALLYPSFLIANLPFTDSALAAPPDPRFGAIETYDAPEAASEMGAGWTRIPFLWARIQPTGSHEWLPPITDQALSDEILQGRQPVGLVITTPGWATDMGIGPGVPYGLHSGHNDPNNLWAVFLRRLASTYAGRIDHWIIWNEPDVWDASHPGYTWGGSVDDFLQLQRVAYLTIKETNPGATVIFAGTSYWWDAAYGRTLYFRHYLDTLVQDLSAPANNYYADAVALHVYFQPDFVYSITGLYHQLMREHGFDKPIWLVETNAAPSLDPQMPAPNSLFSITLDEQAAYIIQAFAMAIAAGAERIGVFKMIDTPTDLVANPEPFGLVRADGSRRPAFNAYQVAATYLAGFQSAQLEQRPAASIVSVTRTDGTTTVLWARTPSEVTVQVPARAASAVLADMWGNRRTISARDGSYSLSLPGASCTHGPPCIIGGPPSLIVEGAGDASALSPAPLAESDSQAQAETPPSDAVSVQETPQPKYTVNLRPIEIKGARDVWHRRGLGGYQIELVSGPPFYLYYLTVVDERVIAAQRSLEPLSIDLSELDKMGQRLAITPTLTTLYNRRNLNGYTVEGLFDRVSGYHKHQSTPPACDTQVIVRLDGDWAFPRLILEEGLDDCATESETASLSVVSFATLTPTPTAPQPTPLPSATPTVSLAPTKSPVPTASPTPPAVGSLMGNPAPSNVPTAHPATTETDRPGSIWVLLLVSTMVAGALLFRENGGKNRPDPDSR